MIQISSIDVLFHLQIYSLLFFYYNPDGLKKTSNHNDTFMHPLFHLDMQIKSICLR